MFYEVIFGTISGVKSDFEDKVNRDNINLVLYEWNNFIEYGDKDDRSSLMN